MHLEDNQAYLENVHLDQLGFHFNVFGPPFEKFPPLNGLLNEVLFSEAVQTWAVQLTDLAITHVIQTQLPFMIC